MIQLPSSKFLASAQAGPADVKRVLDQITVSFDEFKQGNDARFDELHARYDDLEKRFNRPPAFGDPEASYEERQLRAEFTAYLRSGRISEILGAASVGSDPAGGYVVPVTLSDDITRKIFEISPIRQIARLITIDGDAFEEPTDLDEAEAQWVAEQSARPETDTPTFGMLRIPLHEIYASPKATQKLLDTARIDVGGWLTSKIASRFARRENAAFVNGDGTSKPRGFLTHPTSTDDDDTRAWGTLEYVPTGADGAFAATDPGDGLIDLTGTLKSDHRANARWLMNRKTAAAVRKLKDGQGNYLWQQAVIAGQPEALLGFPVTLAEDMPDIASGSLSIAFGDFRAAYTVVEHSARRLLRDPFTDKPNILFYTYERVGGDVNNFECIKLLKFSVS